MGSCYSNTFSKIWMFWKEGWSGEILQDSYQQVTVRLKMNDVVCNITSIYARCSSLERLKQWEELEDISSRIDAYKLSKEISI